MGHLEALASSGNLLHTALEARSALADVNLLHALQDLGHPYGIFLNQTASIGPSSVLSSFVSGDPATQNQLGNTSSEISAGYFNESINFLLPASSEANPSARSLTASLIILAISANTGKLEGSDSKESSWNSLLSSCFPIASSAEFSRIYKDEKKNLTINKNSLSLGTVSLNLTQFHGQEPFTVKSPQGEPVTEIQPGSPLAFLHLNRQAAEMRQLTPLERIQTMTQDLKKVFSLIDNPTSLDGLKPEQQVVLTAAKSAVIVGISHLVPIFHRITNFPTWKLDVLPKAVQEFHRFDSQAVSDQFGGKRQVRVEDIEMTVITPQMRQKLVNTYA